MSKLKCSKTCFVICLIFVIFLNVKLISADNTTEMFINKISSVGGMGYDVSISGDYAYVTSNDGLDIVNIQDPYNPKKVTILEISESAFGVFIKEELAFIAAGGNGLIIADISDPTNPVILGQSSDHGIASGVYATDNYAFMACYEDGLKIFDITNLSNPIKIGDYFDSGRIDDVVIVDNIALVANPSLGLEVVNVTLPSSPQKIRTLASTSGATGLAKSDSLLFVGCYSSSVWILNITNPEYPSILGGHTDTDGGEAQGVVGNSTHVYVADYYGVEFLDISNLPQITEVAENRQGIGSAHDIDFKNNFIFIAGGLSMTCLQIFEISAEQKSQFLGLFIGIPVTIVVVSILFFYIYKYRIKGKGT